MGYGKEVVKQADRLQEEPKRAPPKLSGQDVPVVDKHVYLGLTVTRHFDLGIVARGRLEKAEKAYRKLQSFLHSQHIPAAASATVLRAVVGATLLHGSKIWGMSQERCKPAQTLVNKAVRVTVECKEADGCWDKNSCNAATAEYPSSSCRGVSEASKSTG